MYYGSKLKCTLYMSRHLKVSEVTLKAKVLRNFKVELVFKLKFIAIVMQGKMSSKISIVQKPY